MESLGISVLGVCASVVALYGVHTWRDFSIKRANIEYDMQLQKAKLYTDRDNFQSELEFNAVNDGFGGSSDDMSLESLIPTLLSNPQVMQMLKDSNLDLSTIGKLLKGGK